MRIVALAKYRVSSALLAVGQIAGALVAVTPQKIEPRETLDRTAIRRYLRRSVAPVVLALRPASRDIVDHVEVRRPPPLPHHFTSTRSPVTM
ncbi:hypothetical protein [Methanoculleus sp. 10]|uniref:hypothetical protein n=1 Tax=Methanoculleus sp. 10 TaxID=430615 RepID=UPI001B6E6204|nr:hypothetical protein [Methanoculleus sp. 10]MBP7410621.1 hypothetical protein [Methanoculleus sp.]